MDYKFYQGNSSSLKITSKHLFPSYYFAIRQFYEMFRGLFKISCSSSYVVGSWGFYHPRSSTSFSFTSFIQNLCFLLGL